MSLYRALLVPCQSILMSVKAFKFPTKMTTWRAIATEIINKICFSTFSLWRTLIVFKSRVDIPAKLLRIKLNLN